MWYGYLYNQEQCAHVSAAWSGSTRRRRLPKNWPIIRRRILERDGHRCTWHDHDGRCTAPATDVDHVEPGDDHTAANLQSLCRAHHAAKSSCEGRAAQRPSARRNEPPHPAKGGG